MRFVRGVRPVFAAVLMLLSLVIAGAAEAQSLVLNNVSGTAVSVVGTGQGKRAIWRNAGSVGGATVDIVAVIETATLNHSLAVTSNRPSVTAAGPDNIWIRWYLYQAGTYNISTNSGGVPVSADIHVQFNDVDGPNNERIYVPVCSGDVAWIRIASAATTGRDFGTVGPYAETFSLIGDRNYSEQPESGLEILYPAASSFLMGRTANNGFLIRLDNPTYSAFNTFDYQCADFVPPVAEDDVRIGVPATPTVIDILANDTIATANDNPPHNNSQEASEFARQSVSLIAPPGATGIVTDGAGDIVGFTVPGEGAWAHDDTTGQLTFTPAADFAGAATQIDYTFRNALGQLSNAATVMVTYPGIGVVKTSVFNDDVVADGNAQVGETIDYTYTVTSRGPLPLTSVALAETGFTGTGTPPAPAYVSGDSNGNGALDEGESWVYTASYTLTAADLAAGGVSNQATATAQDAGGVPVSDLSDSGNPGDGNGTGTPGSGPGNDDVTETPFAAAPIDAVDDDFTGAPVNGLDGGVAGNALTNDTLNGSAVAPADVVMSVVAPAAPIGGGPVPALATAGGDAGLVTVPAGTPAGLYAITYRICEVLNPGNCDEAVISIDVAPAPIDAVDDDFSASPVDPASGGLTASVFGNDTLNGAAVVPAEVTASILDDGGLTGVVLNADGTLTVPAALPPGSYPVQYELCEVLNPANCDVAVAIVLVAATPLDAVDDTASANGRTGDPAAGNVLGNDTFGGVPASLADLTLAVTVPAVPVTPGAPVPAVDPATGAISVPAGTPAGVYPITYELCETANPANCDAAVATVTVTAAPIDAVDDAPAPVNGFSGNPSAGNVLGNDTLDGAAADPAEVTVTVTVPATPVTPGAPVPAIDPATGAISVPAGTPAGIYPITYELCEALNPANCDAAVATVTVTAAPIDAVDDAPAPVDGFTGNPSVANVLGNDTLNGAPVNPAEVAVTVLVPAAPVTPGAPVPALDPATGVISVPAGTPAGVYPITYELCEVLNPANCDTAVATVTVGAAPIDAVDDDFTGSRIDPATGGSTASVFGNDTLHGAGFAASAVTAAILGDGGLTGVTMNADGTLSVPAGLAGGTYQVEYRICEVLNPANCGTAVATVLVQATPLDAVNDAPAPVNGRAGDPAAANVLDNDTFGGAPASLADLTLTVTAPAVPVTPGAPVPAVDPATGVVSVPAGTPAGTYPITYQLCETANPANCDSAVVTVTVEAAPIDAVDDAPAPVNGATGSPAAANVLDNDTLDGAPVDPAEVTVSVTTPATPVGPGAPVPALDPATGVVSVPAGTPAGIYPITYDLCEALNPANCDTAVVTVTVEAAPIDAVDDTPAPVNGAAGNPSLANVLDNDLLNGAPVDPAEVVVTVAVPAVPVTPGAPVPVLDPATGEVSVPAGTPAGTYPITYELCEALNPFNCDTATVTVTVEAAPIDAVDDAPAPVNGAAGTPSAANVLDNDTLNGAPVDPAQVTVSVTAPATPVTPGAPVPVLDPATGIVSVPAGTPEGVYPITYELCEALNPANCDTATVTVTVTAAPIDAVDDTPAPVNGTTGNPSVTNVLGNDTLGGAPVDPAQVTVTVTTPATPVTPGAPVPVLNPATGIVSVPPGTPAGTYPITYELCENLNPANCDSATVTVTVAAGVIDAVDDDFSASPVDPASGGVAGNVLGNDTLDGAPVDPAGLTVTLTGDGGLSGVTLSPTGEVVVPAGSAPGSYTLSYTICEALNPANCDSATATVVVAAFADTELLPDVSRGNIPGTPVTIRVIANDSDPFGVIDRTTLQIVGTSGPGHPLVVPGQGVWSVDPGAGTITFTPEPGFLGDPTPIQYVASDVFGNPLAAASVIVGYEQVAAFICSDVIGKVFDDRNGDGRQDAGEPGLPGVRLATATGKIITTDAHGRYSLPCAALPRDRGSNFLVKLDPRSLPTGYRVTGENPRVARLTPGMMSRLNFATALGDLVEIELSAAAFDPRSGEPVEALEEGIEALVAQIARTPSRLKLDYHAQGESPDLAKRRIDRVEEMIREEWKGRGRYRLVIEKTVVRPN